MVYFFILLGTMNPGILWLVKSPGIDFHTETFSHFIFRLTSQDRQVMKKIHNKKVSFCQSWCLLEKMKKGIQSKTQQRAKKIQYNLLLLLHVCEYMTNTYSTCLLNSRKTFLRSINIAVKNTQVSLIIFFLSWNSTTQNQFY